MCPTDIGTPCATLACWRRGRSAQLRPPSFSSSARNSDLVPPRLGWRNSLLRDFQTDPLLDTWAKRCIGFAVSGRERPDPSALGRPFHQQSSANTDLIDLRPRIPRLTVTSEDYSLFFLEMNLIAMRIMKCQLTSRVVSHARKAPSVIMVLRREVDRIHDGAFKCRLRSDTIMTFS
jgi:hypothetical protein